MNQTEIAASLHAALGAHGVWKMRQAVQNGTSPTPIDQVRRDDCCAPGWLLHEHLAAPQRAGAVAPPFATCTASSTKPRPTRWAWPSPARPPRRIS